MGILRTAYGDSSAPNYYNHAMTNYKAISSNQRFDPKGRQWVRAGFGLAGFALFNFAFSGLMYIVYSTTEFSLLDMALPGLILIALVWISFIGLGFAIGYAVSTKVYNRILINRRIRRVQCVFCEYPLDDTHDKKTPCPECGQGVELEH